MKKTIIKNHRGLCEINYCDIDTSVDQIKKLSPVIVISDEILQKINPSLLEKFSFIPNSIFLKSGEKTKTLKGVFDLLNKIESLNISPLNHILIIGGATIQDTCATAFSLLKRGVKWTFIPTTLLAQADSCIGSKTSINSNRTKNLYGLFYSPQYIFITDEVLKSLPEVEILSGIGDAMHYLLLDPIKYFNYILDLTDDISENGVIRFINNPNRVFDLSSKVHKIKKYYIEIDEFDNLERKVLNLGHSFAHALEAFFEYKLAHGIAVLYGLIYAIDLSIFLFKDKNDKSYISSLEKIKKSILIMLKKYSPIPLNTVFNSVIKKKYSYLEILERDKKNINKDSFKLVLFKNNIVKLIECEKEKLVEFFESKKDYDIL